MRPFPAIVLAFMVVGASASCAAHALEAAKYVVAEEITGVVVDSDTGKPIPNAIVAIRFERNNTGHSGPHCFRSMSVQADGEGRFKFAPWKQEDTRANATFGQVKAYKAGYAVPARAVEVPQAPRSKLGVAASETIQIAKRDIRLEMKPFAGSDQERVWELRALFGNFSCGGRGEFDNMALLMRVRDDIKGSSLANHKATPRGRTPMASDRTLSEWVEALIKLETQNP